VAGAGPGPDAESAASRWRQDLESWAIPGDILAAAPESPWGFPTGLFSRATAAALEVAEPTPSWTRALEALPSGGSVLDIGVGAGAASLPLAPPAGLLLAVDESRAMLATFAEAVHRRGISPELFHGRWPDVASATPDADVVVCHHVVYNVADLEPFLRALTEHARRRVVVELTECHPLSRLAPLWMSIHGLERPTAPTSADAVAVVTGLGYDVHVARFDRPSLWDLASLDERVAFARRQLCVGPERDEEIATYFQSRSGGRGERRDLATMWWDVPPPGQARSVGHHPGTTD